MKEKHAFILAAVVALGISTPMAFAKDYMLDAPMGCYRNEYFAEPAKSNSVVIEKSTTVAPGVTQTTITAPVTVEPVAGQAPLMMEDRIIKRKHLFGIGVWPLFDFEIL